ncbi:MAG: sel1 repeat family protein, partial [Methylomicrobium sp.]|nr:sel1 repeat family protein [Methylomicrobium sp.]
MLLAEHVEMAIDNLNLNPNYEGHSLLIKWLDCLNDPCMAMGPKYQEIISFFEKTNHHHDNPDVQHLLGYCTEHGLGDKWLMAVNKMVEIEKLIIALKCEDSKHIEICNKIKDFRDSGEYSKAIKTGDWTKWKGLTNEKNLREIELIGNDKYNELQKSKHLIFSKETYQSKKTSDPNKSFYWYNLAVKNGCNDAIVNLGICYLVGFGVEQDKAKGLSLILEASRYDNGLALQILGNAYKIEGSKNSKMQFYSYHSKFISKSDCLTPRLYGLISHMLYYNADDHNDQMADDNTKHHEELKNNLNYFLYSCAKSYSEGNSIIDTPSNIDEVFDESIAKSTIERLNIAGEILQGCADINRIILLDDTLDKHVWIKRTVAGILYQGLPDNYAKNSSSLPANVIAAVNLWHELANINDGVACFRLAMHYRKVDQLALYLKFLNKSAELGFFPANFSLALVYFQGVVLDAN